MELPKDVQQQLQAMQVVSRHAAQAYRDHTPLMPRLLSVTCNAFFAHCSTSHLLKWMRFVDYQCLPPTHHPTQLEPLQRAEVHLAIAQSAAALMAVFLKATGQLTMQQRSFTQELVRHVLHMQQSTLTRARNNGRGSSLFVGCLDVHQLQERLHVYRKKVTKAAARRELQTTAPTLTLNVAAANRFIDAALPDLTVQQKQALRGLSSLPGQDDDGTTEAPAAEAPQPPTGGRTCACLALTERTCPVVQCVLLHV